MIDKKISLGTVITILTILGTFIYTQGMITFKVESFEEDTVKHSVRINKNSDDIGDLKVAQAKFEAKIDEGFKRLETIILEN